MAETGRTRVNPPHADADPRTLLQSRVVIVEASPHAFEFLLRPTGLSLKDFWLSLFVVIVALLWAVSTAVVITDPLVPPTSRTLISNGFQAIFFVTMLAEGLRVLARRALEWNHIRIKDGHATIRYPRLFRGERVFELDVTSAEKSPKERYSSGHYLRLNGGAKPFIAAYPLLPFEEVKWLIDEINQRIPNTEPHNDGSESKHSPFARAR